MAGTIAAIERELVEDGLVRRWSARRRPARGRLSRLHLLAGRLPRMQGRMAERRAIISERVLALTNDVGLLSEEWDIAQRRMLAIFRRR